MKVVASSIRKWGIPASYNRRFAPSFNIYLQFYLFTVNFLFNSQMSNYEGPDVDGFCMLPITKKQESESFFIWCSCALVDTSATATVWAGIWLPSVSFDWSLTNTNQIAANRFQWILMLLEIMVQNIIVYIVHLCSTIEVNSFFM